MARRFRLRSPHDPVALAERFRAAVPATIDRATPAGVVGRGSEYDFELRYHRPNSRNDFATRLTATIEAESGGAGGGGGGSIIAGRVGMARRVRVFMAVWFSFLALFALGAVPMVLLAAGMAGEFWYVPFGFLALPIAMMGFGVLLLRLGRRHAAHDEAAMLDFLARVGDAHPIGTKGR